MSDSLICVQNLSFSVGGTEILRHVSLDVKRGEYLSIIGPNGAGKTTLLKCMNRILTGWKGGIQIQGRPVHEYTQRELARELGYVPQADGRRSPFTVRELVLMGRYPHLSPFTSPTQPDEEAVDRALELTGTTRFANRRHGTLSGGECQKVHIAAALAQEAHVLLLDEPTTFLDPHHQADISVILRKLNRDEGVTIMAVTHDINSAALYSSRIVAMKDGGIAFRGTPLEVMTAEVLSSLYDKPFTFVNHPHTGLPMTVPEAIR